MKTLYRVSFFVFISANFLACSPKVVKTTTNSKATTIPTDYEEDLSVVRPRYDVKPVASASTVEKKIEREKPTVLNDIPLEVNARLEAALDTIANQNKSIKFAQGYRIQAYVGNNRQDMDAARDYIGTNFPELNTYLTYNQPTYKLKIGDFMSRMDAERYFGTIKQEFSGATLVNDKIDVKKALIIK